MFSVFFFMIFVNPFDVFGTMAVHIVIHARAYLKRQQFFKTKFALSPLHPVLIRLLCVKSSPKFVYRTTVVIFFLLFFVFYIQLKIIKANIYTTLLRRENGFFFLNVFPV